MLVGLVFYVNASWDSPDTRPTPVMTARSDSATLAYGEFLFKFSTTCWGCHSSVNDANAPPAGGRPLDLREVGYLANHRALCADCHTPRNLTNGEFYFDSLFAGSSTPFGEAGQVVIEAFAPNITPDKETGIGGWNEEDFMLAVQVGTMPDGKVLSPEMPYHAYGKWSEEDLHAVYLYLRGLPAIRRMVPQRVFVNELTTLSGVVRGETIFRRTCEVCHGEKGKGAAPTSVALAEVAPSLDDETMMDFVTTGNAGLHMPGFGKTFTREQLTDVIAFVRSWQR